VLSLKEALFATQQKRPDEFNHLTLLLQEFFPWGNF
jgi:hypothetical protein